MDFLLILWILNNLTTVLFVKSPFVLLGNFSWPFKFLNKFLIHQQYMSILAAPSQQKLVPSVFLYYCGLEFLYFILYPNIYPIFWNRIVFLFNFHFWWIS